MKKKLLMVLGMHRSGTSALSGLISDSGVSFGSKLLKGNKFNEKGYFEDKTFFTLNKKMLFNAGYSWDSLEELNFARFKNIKQAIYRSKLRKEIKRLANDGDVVGIKDPRNSILLPIWKKILNNKKYDVYYIITARHPAEVALSHKKRDGFSINKGLKLWLNYNQAIIKYSADEKCFYTSFVDAINSPNDLIKNLGSFINHELKLDKADNFVDKKLKNNNVSDFDKEEYNEELYSECIKCYETLLEKNSI